MGVSAQNCGTRSATFLYGLAALTQAPGLGCFLWEECSTVTALSRQAQTGPEIGLVLGPYRFRSGCSGPYSPGAFCDQNPYAFQSEILEKNKRKISKKSFQNQRKLTAFLCGSVSWYFKITALPLCVCLLIQTPSPGEG